MNGLKIYSLEEVLDKHIGKNGTPKREKFEFEVQMGVIGDMIKRARKNKSLTQEQLGKLVGVEKLKFLSLRKVPRMLL